MSQVITRRTLARGAAWSVPVVALASAAPASAVSGNCSTDSLSVDVFSVDIAEKSVHVGMDLMSGNYSCTGGQRGVTVSFTAELSAPYTRWDASTLTPTSGTAPGTVMATVNHLFINPVDMATVDFVACFPAGATPAPITFTVSADGAPSASVVVLD
ncbi:hypothetical protein GCM10011492_22350 [Flexivirga endophytica]|uniref:Uncharacterized protein n=1 Tax=Flexivirga endophytica TaxID=1849103 RepID=A0A916T575_9MICO|nr:hypothetical protein [Flexivirga endophytica]GGB31270.1 hypothetical protein GCM10011492_22350 [Flexivirga endophytica]GHB52204.1 hypothetical protein GCM10008112_21620 [Flexivirga endophytica]